MLVPSAPRCHGQTFPSIGRTQDLPDWFSQAKTLPSTRSGHTRLSHRVLVSVSAFVGPNGSWTVKDSTRDESMKGLMYNTKTIDGCHEAQATSATFPTFLPLGYEICF